MERHDRLQYNRPATEKWARQTVEEAGMVNKCENNWKARSQGPGDGQEGSGERIRRCQE